MSLKQYEIATLLEIASRSGSSPWCYLVADVDPLLAERATLAAEVERLRGEDRRALLLSEKLLQVARALGLNDVPIKELLEGDEVVQKATAIADENKRFNGALDALGKLGSRFQSALAPAAKEG